MKRTWFIGIIIFSQIYYTQHAAAQVNVVKFPELDSFIASQEGHEIKVINFWATWCAPCIKELPYFESLKEKYPDDQLDVLLVSLDFAEHTERVNKFLDQKNISTKVWLLDESDANSYIDKIDNRWSGAIPMTLLIHPATGKRIFIEKELTNDELEQHINSLLK
jgi:thiol-disulfide isomerase/thioredoxin